MKAKVGLISNKSRRLRWAFKLVCPILFVAQFLTCPTEAQTNLRDLEKRDKVMNSENGWYLSPHGIIKVLMLFVEVDYDITPDNDRVPGGLEGWRQGELPSYADDVFDPGVLSVPKATMTRYYHFCSLGNLRVLGDYWPETVTLKESDIGKLNLTTIKRGVVDYLNKAEVFMTAHGSTIDDFDLWQGDTKVGMPRVNEPDDPHSFDHVMMFLRNFHGLRPGHGSASGFTFGPIFGLSSDSYSQFSGPNELPQRILRHEFNHLLLGGNNFHCCGGSATVYTNYFIPDVYGWGLMGAANSSFEICNAWDRHRLGWKQSGKKYLLSAISENGSNEKMADLHTDSAHHQGKYLLRDFATTGDAVRIKLPYIDSTQFQQYLWIENHQCADRNGVEFDRFVNELEPGYTKAQPGLYMMIQVDKDKKEGLRIFGEYANYLRPVLADGHFDVQFTGDTLPWHNDGKLHPVHDKPQKFANPLTGSQDMEGIPYNKNPEDSTLEHDDMVDPLIEFGPDGTRHNFLVFGHERHAFRMAGNFKIGIGTNPSTASLITNVSGKSIPRNENAGNNRQTMLNGISVEIIEERSDGAILVDIRFDQTTVKEDMRWCSDTIIVNNNNYNSTDLELASKTKLLIDHGETATRRTNPTYRKGKQVFVSPTVFILKPGTKTVLRKGSRLIVDNCCQLIIEPGAELVIEPGAKVILKNGAEMYVEPAGIVTGKKRAVKTRSGSSVTYFDN